MRQRTIEWSEVRMGTDVVVQFKQPQGCGQGGTVEWCTDLAIRIRSGDHHAYTYWRKEIDRVTVEEYLDAEECLDWRSDGECEGPVDYRWVGGMNGRAWPRCERHADRRQARYEASELERYADSDVAPSWFDPTAIGERWDDDY